MQISSRCLLSFSIGNNYEDEIWCDIVPMDASHVLSGRPLLFHRSVMPDGQLNTYTFAKDHKKITLTPLKPTSQRKPQDTPSMDVFLTTLLYSQLYEYDDFKDWILLGREPAEAKDCSHPLLTPLLKAFEHVFPSEVPYGLPKDPYNTKLTLFPVPPSQTSRPSE